MSPTRAIAAIVLGAVCSCAAPNVARPASHKGPAARVEPAAAPSPAAAVGRPFALPPTDLFIQCDDPLSCPEAVGMVVFEDEQTSQRCTGTLVRPDQVLTASHCVAPALRHAGASCRGAWMAFPARSTAPAEWVQCDEVTAIVGAVAADALHPEYALLRLARPLDRVPLQLLGAPIEPGSIVTVISVTPHPVYGSSHTLDTRLCRAIDSEPAERALGATAGRVGWLSHCPIRLGNSGSPVLDAEGRVRAIVHGGTWTGFGLGVTSGLR